MLFTGCSLQNEQRWGSGPSLEFCTPWMQNHVRGLGRGPALRPQESCPSEILGTCPHRACGGAWLSCLGAGGREPEGPGWCGDEEVPHTLGRPLA
jgi:hypothetical protein